MNSNQFICIDCFHLLFLLIFWFVIATCCVARSQWMSQHHENLHHFTRMTLLRCIHLCDIISCLCWVLPYRLPNWHPVALHPTFPGTNQKPTSEPLLLVFSGTLGLVIRMAASHCASYSFTTKDQRQHLIWCLNSAVISNYASQHPPRLNHSVQSSN